MRIVLLAMALLLCSVTAAVAGAFFQSSNVLPPVVIYNETSQVPIIYGLHGIGGSIRGFTLSGITGSITPPALGNTVMHSFSTIAGFWYQPYGTNLLIHVSAPVNASVRTFHSSDVLGTSYFQEEITSLNIVSGDRMVRIRESPTMASTGQATIEPAEGGYMIESFFDVFTELSLDDGMTWIQTSSSMHLEASPEPSSLLVLSGGLVSTLCLALRRRRS